MSRPHTMIFDVVLDEWPAGVQGGALQSLADSGDIVAITLPHGFVGLRMARTQIRCDVDARRIQVQQIRPTVPAERAPVSR